MDVELIEIREFLASNAPFDQLPEATLEALPKRLSVRYLRRGTAFPPGDDPATTRSPVSTSCAAVPRSCATPTAVSSASSPRATSARRPAAATPR